MTTHEIINNEYLADEALLSLCRTSLKLEAQSISSYADRIGVEFLTALRLLRDARDPVVVTGIGKSGHIARKIASTFRSIGCSAVFLHAAEASHGDLGLIGSESVAIVISSSGETSELSDLIHYCEEHEVPMIAIVSDVMSTLGRRAKVTLAYGKVKEACPNGLAPTTSTTLALAIGDALAAGLVHMIGTTPEDFRRYHPGGNLGTQLLRVVDIMHTGDSLPIVHPDLPMQEVVITMSAKAFGVALLVKDDKLCGIITDGDMRRNVNLLWQARARDVSLGLPLTIMAESLVSEAIEKMSSHVITCLPVQDATGKLVGIIHMHDCLRVK